MHMISGASRHWPDDVIEFDRLMSNELNTAYEEKKECVLVNRFGIGAACHIIMAPPIMNELATLTIVLKA